jgi:hypothetical protein
MVGLSEVEALVHAIQAFRVMIEAALVTGLGETIGAVFEAEAEAARDLELCI